MEQDRHISCYDISEQLVVGYKTVLRYLRVLSLATIITFPPVSVIAELFRKHKANSKEQKPAGTMTTPDRTHL